VGHCLNIATGTKFLHFHMLHYFCCCTVVICSVNCRMWVVVKTWLYSQFHWRADKHWKSVHFNSSQRDVRYTEHKSPCFVFILYFILFYIYFSYFLHANIVTCVVIFDIEKNENTCSLDCSRKNWTDFFRWNDT